MDHVSSKSVFSPPSGRKTPIEPFPPVLASAVRSALERVLRSPEFRASRRNRKFLQRVVEAELTGHGHEINGFVIGSEVFGRGKSFDHAKDPIVRIEATKLRRDLERYYLTAGSTDRIVITIPPGAYRPAFETRDVSEHPVGITQNGALDPAGVTIASLCVTEGPLASAQPPFRAQLADALTRQGDVSVYVGTERNTALLDSDAVRALARGNGAAFVLSGDAWSSNGSHRLVVRLHDGASGRLDWSEEFAQDAPGVASIVAQRVVAACRKPQHADRRQGGADGPL